MCVYVKTFLAVSVYVFLCVYGGMYVFLSECVYVFMYLYACKFDERERKRKVLGGQFDCLEEGCYLSPISNNFLSYRQILSFSVVKLMLCPLNIGKQNVTTGFDVLSTFFKTEISTPIQLSY